jgi:hypothetical protein
MDRESFPPSIPGPRTSRASLNASHASHIYVLNANEVILNFKRKKRWKKVEIVFVYLGAFSFHLGSPHPITRCLRRKRRSMKGEEGVR